MSIQPPREKQVVTIPLPPQQRKPRRPRAHWVAVAALAAVAVAIAAVLTVSRNDDNSPQNEIATPTATASSSPSTAAAISLPPFAAYTIGELNVRLPHGAGWRQPKKSEPTPGRLYRTTVKGPNGAFVLVDYTPNEPARFYGGYNSRTGLEQPTFESALAYSFTSSQMNRCSDDRCIDVILNRGPAGYAVLAGGPDFDQARAVALRVTRSFSPNETTSSTPDGQGTPDPAATQDESSYSQTCTVKAWYTGAAASADFGYIHFKCVDDEKETTVDEALGSDNFSFRDEQNDAKRTTKREQLVAKLRSQLEADGWTHIGTVNGGQWYEDRYGR